jgi:hypothetical protein
VADESARGQIQGGRWRFGGLMIIGWPIILLWANVPGSRYHAREPAKQRAVVKCKRATAVSLINCFRFYNLCAMIIHCVSRRAFEYQIYSRNLLLNYFILHDLLEYLFIRPLRTDSG